MSPNSPEVLKFLSNLTLHQQLIESPRNFMSDLGPTPSQLVIAKETHQGVTTRGHLRCSLVLFVKPWFSALVESGRVKTQNTHQTLAQDHHNTTYASVTLDQTLCWHMQDAAVPNGNNGAVFGIPSQLYLPAPTTQHDKTDGMWFAHTG